MILFVIKNLQQRFIAPVVYSISEYVNKCKRGKASRKDKDGSTETDSGTEGARRKGCPLVICKKSQDQRQGALHSRKGFLQPSGKTCKKQENRIRFLQRVGLTIFYLDFLDSHPHYGLTMLKELWLK